MSTPWRMTPTPLPPTRDGIVPGEGAFARFPVDPRQAQVLDAAVQLCQKGAIEFADAVALISQAAGAGADGAMALTAQLGLRQLSQDPSSNYRAIADSLDERVTALASQLGRTHGYGPHEALRRARLALGA